MGLFSGFTARKQEREELEALDLMSRSISARINSLFTRGAFPASGLFKMEPPELAAISNGLTSKSPKSRDQALSIMKHVENIEELEHLVVHALLSSHNEQVKINSLQQDIPRIESTRAVGVFAHMARDNQQSDNVRQMASSLLADHFHLHPDGSTLLSSIVGENTLPGVIYPILVTFKDRTLEPQLAEKILTLRGHDDIKTVAETFQFLSINPSTRITTHEKSHLARYVGSNRGNLLKAQVHAGLMSSNIDQRSASCALIAKDPRVAEDTLERLIEGLRGVFAAHTTLFSDLLEKSEFSIAAMLFPDQQQNTSMRFPGDRTAMGSTQLWIHALGYAAAHAPYNQKVIDALNVVEDRVNAVHTRNTFLSHHQWEKKLPSVVVWRDLLFARHESEALSGLLTSIYSGRKFDASVIKNAAIAGCEISDWTGPMQLDCAPAIQRCLKSGNPSVRAHSAAIAATLASKIKDGAQLAGLLPKDGTEYDQAFHPIIQASFAPDSPETIADIQTSLMHSSAMVSRAALFATERLGAKAAGLQGELTLLALSEDEATSKLARHVLSTLGIDPGEQDSGGDNFFTLRLAS